MSKRIHMQAAQAIKKARRKTSQTISLKFDEYDMRHSSGHDTISAQDRQRAVTHYADTSGFSSTRLKSVN
ncbi:hypothetical protein H8K33_06175 [Undibacterium amnicola]|uniref:Uncharacterized protein n=1 Tax=Undibacterium amnicola TaxID=1834038 RepID=A0ABR6XNK0_9BURK|nr:hypothetical protein [Undibacterium amnicola]MBC3831087.1 hypothetical protein [Undibacterium amnicola]